MIQGRLRQQNKVNVFIVFTDLLFVTVFILLLQVLSQGLVVRSQAEASLRQQRHGVMSAIADIEARNPEWHGIAKVYQHESLQRITFGRSMVFRRGSANIEGSGVAGSSLLRALARELQSRLPRNSTVTIVGFYGPGETEALGSSRANAAMRIFRSSGFPGYRLVASSHGSYIPTAYGYDADAPDMASASSLDRRIEILILCRRE